jgi:cytidylate kinase
MSPPPDIVAIDGPAGSGKSTLARALALELDLPYVNTGLMYRALAADAIRTGVSPDDAEGLLRLTARSRFTLVGSLPRELQVEGYTLDDLTTPTVERTVSVVAAHPAVRAWMRDAQRALGAEGAVMEGRDIGSVVFPEARVKIYLDAHAHDRSERRADERDRLEPQDVAAALEARDELDARTNPFAPAAGAVVIDTGPLDAAATLRTTLDLIRERAPDLIR